MSSMKDDYKLLIKKYEIVRKLCINFVNRYKTPFQSSPISLSQSTKIK